MKGGDDVRNWLIDHRKAKGLTQKEVADLVKISQPSICDIERGIKTPKPNTAKRIAAVLEFEWTRFFDK